MHITKSDYYSMSAWVSRTLSLPFGERIKIMQTPLSALPPIDAWEEIERLSDPCCPDFDADEKIGPLMEKWSNTYLTNLGKNRLSGLLRQRRHRKNKGMVQISIPKNVYHLLRISANNKSLTIAQYLSRILPTENGES